MADASHFCGIERTLNEIDSSTMSAQQLMQTHNDYFSTLPSGLCTEVNKDIIIIRENSQRYEEESEAQVAQDENRVI